MKRYGVVVEVFEVCGRCPAYREGDRMVIEMPELVIRENDRVCIHTFGAMQTFLQALARRYPARELGIGDKDDEGYVQYPDLGPSYT